MKKSTNKGRRNFLGSIAAGAATMGMMAVPNQVKAFPGMVQEPPDDLEAWFKDLKGKHKMVFDSPHPNGILPFAWPMVFQKTNEATGTPAAEANVVVVLRHFSIGYALNDKMWEKYKLGELFKVDDPQTKKPALRNIFNNPKPDDFKVPGIGPIPIGINQLQASGVKFCVCETAITVNSAGLAASMNLNAEEIKKDWTANILPGVKPVPSGVWAIGRAQENGCAYCFAG